MCVITTKLDDDETGRIDDGGSDYPTVRGAGSNRCFCGLLPFLQSLHFFELMSILEEHEDDSVGKS